MPVPCPVSSDSDPDAAFLAEVRAFLAEALTPDLREAGRRTLGVHSDIAACRLWHQRLFRRGWIAPGWPVAHGGTGLTPRQRFLFDRECALNDAPVLFAGGIRSLGPLIIEMGTPLQQARYLPVILSGEDLWAQGFSEPGAGSDLARIATRAEREGDHYRVTGAKIWTTGAHLANRMFALVRTETGEKPFARIVIADHGKEKRSEAAGAGPVDATFRALETIVNSGAELQLYSVNNVTEGTDSQGEVTVRLSRAGRVVNGIGSDTDIVIASAKAYLNALNKMAHGERMNPQMGD